MAAAATGPSAAYGEAEFNAAQLIADAVNANGGINGQQIRLITRDDGGDADKAVAITQEFISQGVDAILGSANSGPALAAGPLAEEAGVLYVTAMAANPGITVDDQGNVRKWVFRIAQSDNTNAEFLADYAFATNDRVALLSDTSGYGSGGRAALQEYLGSIGKELVADETYESGTPDLTAQLQKIAAADADVVITWSIIPDVATIAKGMDSLGLDIPILGLPALDGNTICELAGPAAVGIRHLNTWDPDKPEAAAASAEWQQTLNEPLDNYFGASSYDAMKLLVSAFEAAGHDREAVRSALESTTNHIGALGKVGSGVSFSATSHDGLGKDGILVKEITDEACARQIIN
ncbi:MAG: ABC transporter substrate-binding protein [Actinomycetota bacterium]|nr:ABC transporter substrate-binding protein [Actinomycetota bacterium]